ncbi:MAG: AAA-like domain-containing protein [Bacteroidales bacterium]|nr:AAA-like domain-containing protein [Bacteroidales bacterium]
MDLQVGKPVTGDNLIGRKNEITLITELLKEGQSVALIAPRRYGKTSLMLEVIGQLVKDNFYSCYVDIFSVPNIKIFAERITESVLSNVKMSTIFRKFKNNVVELAKQLQIKQEFDGMEFVLGFSQKDINEWQLLEQSIEFIEKYAIKKNKKIIVAFDEIGDIKKLDGEQIIKLLRSKIQLQKNTAYLFTGSYESVMEQMFVRSNSPFYRFARIINIGTIDLNEFSAYIIKKLASENITIKNDVIKEILRFTGGHPYYTQLLLQELVLQFRLSNNKKLPGISVTINNLLIIEKNYLEKYWETISVIKEERIVLLELAAGSKSLYSVINRKDVNIARALKNLTGKGAVIKKENAYFLTDPLFEYWIKKYVIA